MTDKPKKKRGLANADPEKRKKVAASGGRAVRDQGKLYQWSSDKAKAAANKRWEKVREAQDRIVEEFQKDQET